jgi:hypothetical protein
MNLGTQQQKQLRVSKPLNLSDHKETEALKQARLSQIPVSTIRCLGKNSASQAFKPNFQQNQFKKKMLDNTPEENTLKVNI